MFNYFSISGAYHVPPQPPPSQPASYFPTPSPYMAPLSHLPTRSLWTPLPFSPYLASTLSAPHTSTSALYQDPDAISTITPTPLSSPAAPLNTSSSRFPHTASPSQPQHLPIIPSPLDSEDIPPQPFVPTHPPWYYQLISGAVAGGIAAFVVSPLDVARIRIQIAPKDAKVDSFGFNIIRGMIHKEGIVSLYSGLPTNMFALIPNWMSYFTAYSQFREHLNPVLVPLVGPTGFDILNALFAGGVSTFCTHPLWLVKARFQVQGLKQRFGTETPPNLTHPTGYIDNSVHHMYKGTFDALIKIARSEGLKGLYNGFIPQLLGLIHVGIHFPLYEACKRQLYQYNCSQLAKQQPDGNFSLENIKDQMASTHFNINTSDKTIPGHLSTLQIVLASSISKVIACAVAYPHEILRSRFQTQDFLSDTKSKYAKRQRYTSIPGAIKNIIQTEGIGGLYRGLDLTMMRSVPACIVTFVVYEYTMALLKESKLSRVIEKKSTQSNYNL